MELRLRPYAAAGVAIVGASAIAMAPVAPPLQDIKIANPSVNLSATVDPFTPWVDVFEGAEANIADLIDDWAEAPFPVLQQIIVNQLSYLHELPDFAVIAGQISHNIKAAAMAPFTPGPESVDPAHAALLQLLPALDLFPPDFQPLIDLAASPASGVLFGLVGPVVAPLLALSSSVQAIVGNLTSADPDLEAAFDTLINIPARMANAFLNGGETLDLTPVLNALGVDLKLNPVLPPAKVGLTFGGLLSPGGSFFNAVDIATGPIKFAGQGPGTIGSLINLSHAIARAIGWDGSGNPLEVEDAPTPPPLPRSGGANDTTLLKSNTVSITTTDVSETDAPKEESSTPPVEEAPVSPAEETPAPVESAPEEDSSVVIDEGTDTSETATPAKKRVNPGAKIAGALKNAGDQIGNALNDLGKRLTKQPTKKAPAADKSEGPSQDKADAPSKEKASDDAAA